MNVDCEKKQLGAVPTIIIPPIIANQTTQEQDPNRAAYLFSSAREGLLWRFASPNLPIRL